MIKHKIKLLAAGCSSEDRLKKRWGISFLIDDDILFDTFGDPIYFFNKTKKYNVNLKKIKNIIISHQHWDHISGLWKILDYTEKPKIYICKHTKIEIKEKIASYNKKVIETNDFLMIKKNIFVTGEIFNSENNSNVYEQSLVIKTNAGLTIITGCAHPGIIEIIKKVKNKFNENINLLVGGFHLKDKTSDEIDATIRSLLKLNIQKIAPTHCTGMVATKKIVKSFKDNFVDIKEGTVLNIP